MEIKITIIRTGTKSTNNQRNKFMFKLELCDKQIKALTQILNNALDNYELFLTLNDDDEIFDHEFYKEIKQIRNKLLTKGINQ